MVGSEVRTAAIAAGTVRHLTRVLRAPGDIRPRVERGGRDIEELKKRASRVERGAEPLESGSGALASPSTKRDKAGGRAMWASVRSETRPTKRWSPFTRWDRASWKGDKGFWKFA